ncbi:hypothetical protein [Hymenobacter armeniacus]|uniref:Uncharacterized protein n=1 Tax=Hymenobacter armeniacus TaxID=2771358 RepID=A0ABR8JVC8_9BACT|nr:hypothetical protein [Hymenobacter armeniacus]MBD2722545.1 hypothetical protein [Hymenobacter armeniacus]
MPVEDNGVGFDPVALGEEGSRLKNLESRMAYLVGRADFDVAPRQGTAVAQGLPLVMCSLVKFLDQIVAYRVNV